MQPSLSQSKTRVSFIGMGIMGSAMAFNLLRAGHSLRVWNRSQSRAVLAELQDAGADVVPQLKDCVADSDIIFTCLGDEQDVISRLTGAQDSILACGAKRSALVIDFSTIGPEAARAVEGKLSSAGMRFLDAPVTGGDVGARNATLTIMVGGAQADFDQALPLLNVLGKNIRYCGPSGAGQALKLCNQILCAVNMISVCEALTLAQALDLDQNLVVDVLAGGAGGSWALANLGKRILQDDLKPAFSLRNMLKDLRLVFASVNPQGPDSDPAHAIPPAPASPAAPAVPAIPAIQSDVLPGSALAQMLFSQVAAEGENAPDDFGTQAMIRAYKQGLAKSYQLPGARTPLGSAS